MKGKGTQKRTNPIKTGFKWSKRIFKILKWVLIILIFILLFNFLLSFFGLAIPFPFGTPSNVDTKYETSEETNTTATPPITNDANVEITVAPTSTPSVSETLTESPNSTPTVTVAVTELITTSTPTTTETPTATPSPSPTPTATPTATPSPTPTATPTATPSPTPTATLTATPSTIPTVTSTAAYTSEEFANDSNQTPSNNSSTNSNVATTPSPTSYIFTPSVENSPTPKAPVSTLPPANSVLNYDYVTYIEIDLATIKDLFDTENAEIDFYDLQLSISNNTLNIMSDNYLVEFDTYSSVFSYLQNKGIILINIQNLYTLNVASILSCCKQYDITKMHVKWNKDSSTDLFKMKFVMDQSIWSIITKGVCNYDLTN